MKINGAGTIARRSKYGTPIYFDITTSTVYDMPGENRLYVTDLMRKNTAAEIAEAVNRWLGM